MDPYTVVGTFRCWIRRDDLDVVTLDSEVSCCAKDGSGDAVHSRQERFRNYGDAHGCSVGNATDQNPT